MKEDNRQHDLIVAAALEYASYGWHVLPIIAGTKRPRPNRWQERATTDEEQIAEWWETNPSDGVGVQMGQRSGIIDIEADDEEAEQLWHELWTQAGIEQPVTPTFKSTRGKHRIFKWSADLPAGDKGVFKVGKLEIRTGNAGAGIQTVFPPSKHPSGAQYAWTIPARECDVAELPPQIIATLANMAGEDVKASDLRPAPKRMSEERRVKLLGGLGEGERNQGAAEFVGVLMQGMRDPFNANQIKLQWQMACLWNQNNLPPLEETELEKTFQSILQREQRKRASAQAEPLGAQVAGPATSIVAAVDAEKEWRLVIVESKPRVYRLYSYLWPRRVVELTSQQMVNPASIRVQVLEQADLLLPAKGFDLMWNGGKDVEPLGQRLVATAEFAESPLEANRDLVVAELLLEQLGKAWNPPEGAPLPPKNGRPWIDPRDGTVYFTFSKVWEPLARFDDRIKRTELSAVLQLVGVKDQQMRSHGGPPIRWKKATKSVLHTLRRMCGYADEPA